MFIFLTSCRHPVNEKLMFYDPFVAFYMHINLTTCINNWWCISYFSFQISVIENIRSKRNLDEHEHELKLFKRTISPLMMNLYKFIGVFLLGTASCQLLTDIGKYSIGRFRPHFITVSDVFIYYLWTVIIMFSCSY